MPLGEPAGAALRAGNSVYDPRADKLPRDGGRVSPEEVDTQLHGAIGATTSVPSSRTSGTYTDTHACEASLPTSFAW